MRTGTTSNGSAAQERGLVLIGAFKLFKAALLVCLGLGVFSLLSRHSGHALQRWIEHARVDPHNRFIHKTLARVFDLNRKQLQAVGLGTFIYAAIFATEGIGLLLRKTWAEYLTLCITTSFIPLEAYELVKRPNLAKAILIIGNVAIVAYLVWNLKRSRTKTAA